MRHSCDQWLIFSGSRVIAFEKCVIGSGIHVIAPEKAVIGHEICVIAKMRDFETHVFYEKSLGRFIAGISKMVDHQRSPSPDQAAILGK